LREILVLASESYEDEEKAVMAATLLEGILSELSARSSRLADGRAKSAVRGT